MADIRISNEETEIKLLYIRIADIILDKSIAMNTSTRRAVAEVVMDSIQKIGQIMSQPIVRVHNDPNLHNPEVTEKSSWNSILRRLRHQIRVVRNLVKMTQIGSPRNDEEADALNRVKETLCQVWEDISPTLSILSTDIDW